MNEEFINELASEFAKRRKCTFDHAYQVITSFVTAFDEALEEGDEFPLYYRPFVLKKENGQLVVRQK